MVTSPMDGMGMDILQPNVFFFSPTWVKPHRTLRCAHGRPTVYPLASLAQLENRGLGHKWTKVWAKFIAVVGDVCLI